MTGSPHPELDALSAALDGEDDDAAAHATTCAVCGRELDRLRVVQQLVAVEPTVSDDLIERLVTTAVQSATVTPFSSARRTGPRRPSAGWLAAAAAAIAVVAALPALLGGLGSGDDMLAKDGGEAFESAEGFDTGGGQAGEVTADAGTAADADALGEGAGSALASGDLGDQSDPAALAAAVASMSGQAAAQGTSAAAAGRTAPGAESAPAVGAPAPPACESPTRAVGAGRLGRLVYLGSVRWRGEPAEVLAFELVRAEGVRPGERQLYVLRPQGCSVLAEQRF